MNELKIQTELVLNCRRLGGYGMKMQNKHIAGVPDLLLSLPHTGAVIVEVKVKGGALTPLQKLTIQSMRNGGIKTGWAIVEYIGNGNAVVWAGNDVDNFGIKGNSMAKERGGNWPIEYIINACK